MIRSISHPRAPVAGALLALILLACGGGDGAPGSDSSAEGKKPLVPIREAPPFELETLEGDPFSYEELSEKDAVLMNFWASWCAPCRAEVPDLIALHDAYVDEGFMVLGVTVNDLPRDSREFVEEMDMTYPSVIGTPAMLEDYKVSPWLPTTLLIKDGEVVREWVGPRSREEFEFPVKAALGKVPNLSEVVKSGADGTDGSASEGGEPPAGAEPARRPSNRSAADTTEGSAGEAREDTDR